MNSKELFPNYVTIIERQETTDGEVCYVAHHPELPTCLGQGATPEEATLDLADAAALVLEYLAEQGLPIPRPQNSLLGIHAQRTSAYPTTQKKIVAPSAGLHGLPVGVA